MKQIDYVCGNYVVVIVSLVAKTTNKYFNQTVKV